MDQPKILSPAQQAWLDGVLMSMNNTINTTVEPIEDLRTPLQKALDDDHFLQDMHCLYYGAMAEAQSLKLSKSQMPDIYSIWVARRATLGRGPPVKKELNKAYQEAVASGHIAPEVSRK